MGDKKQIDRSPLPRGYWGPIVAMLTTACVLGFLSWTGYHDAINKAEPTSSGIARVNAFALDTTLNTVDMLLAESASLLAAPNGLATGKAVTSTSSGGMSNTGSEPRRR